MNIRPARAGDAEACARLWVDFGQALIERGLPFRMPATEGLAQWFEEIIAFSNGEKQVALVAADDDVCGLAVAKVREPAPSPQFSFMPSAGTLCVILEDIVVAAARRHQGIGAQLLRVVEDWARTKGATQVRLNSDVDGPAADFYLRHGYERAAALYIREL